PPTISALFPYTTLFRSLYQHENEPLSLLPVFRGCSHNGDIDERFSRISRRSSFPFDSSRFEPPGDFLPRAVYQRRPGGCRVAERSEEHTSELQSRENLV